MMWLIIVTLSAIISTSNLAQIVRRGSLPLSTKFNFGKLVAAKALCGFQHSDDYFHSNNGTVITQFPWMVLIEYRLKNNTNAFHPKGKYLCNGSLISHKYVLTGAQCLVKKETIPVSVRLGEYDIKNETDCIQDVRHSECADAAKDYEIEKIIPHPEYKVGINQIDDIGLIRIKGKVEYSDYIRPICLPIYSRKRPKPGNVILTSGWASNELLYFDYVEIKKLAFSKLISEEECLSIYNITHPAKGKFMCSLSSNDSDSICNGDEGGPVMYNRKLQWYQVAIVTLGWCREAYPDVFTSVEYYLDWIYDNLKP